MGWAASLGGNRKLGAKGKSMFDTKIAIVVREDLATWQKLNVTAFLTSGIVGANEGLLGLRQPTRSRHHWCPC